MYSKGKWISMATLVAWLVSAIPAAGSPQHQFMPPAAPAAPDEARDLFNVAVKFYDEDKLEEAEKRLREVVQKFPKNIIADRAAYYLIRTLTERGKRNDALARINAFPRTYPKSKWSVDVEELRIRLTTRVSPVHMTMVTAPPFPPPPPPPPGAGPAAAPPRPVEVQVDFQQQNARRNQTAARVNQQVARAQQQQALREAQQQNARNGTPPDPEVALQQEIMRAVFQTSPDRAIEIATARLQKNPADPLVLSSLYLVAESRSAEALPMLLTIAKNTTNSKARKDAIFWISQSKADREMLVDTLVDLLPSVGEEEAESVSFALGQLRHEKATNALATIARDKGKSQKVRDNALFWIGESRTANRAALLEDIYKNSMDNSRTRQQVLFALSESRDPRAASILGSVAGTDPDIEVRKQAVFWLGQIRTPEARQALENLLQKR